MFTVVRVNAVRGQDDLPVSLIRIDGRHADTRMRVNPREDKSIRTVIRNALIKSCGVECAVPLLNEDRVGRTDG
jgi:hypothetical protein